MGYQAGNFEKRVVPGTSTTLHLLVSLVRTLKAKLFGAGQWKEENGERG
jgi:hypothetical protein